MRRHNQILAVACKKSTWYKVCENKRYFSSIVSDTGRNCRKPTTLRFDSYSTSLPATVKVKVINHIRHTTCRFKLFLPPRPPPPGEFFRRSIKTDTTAAARSIAHSSSSLYKHVSPQVGTTGWRSNMLGSREGVRSPSLFMNTTDTSGLIPGTQCTTAV